MSTCAAKAAVDALPGISAVFAHDGRCTYAGAGLASFTGQAAGELIGAGWRRWVHPEDHGVVLGRPGAPSDEKPATHFRLRRADGTWRRIHVTTTPLVGRAGGPGERLLVGTDAEDRLVAEEDVDARGALGAAQLAYSRRLAGAHTETEVFDATGQGLLSALPYRRVWAFQLDADGGFATLLFRAGLDGPTTARLALGDDVFLKEVFSAANLVVSLDARVDPRTDKAAVTASGVRTVIGVPLLFPDGRLGALGLGTCGDEGSRAPTAPEREFLVAVAGLFSAAFGRVIVEAEHRAAQAALREHQEHHEQVVERSLTGLLRQERTLKRLNRTLATLSAGNEALIRARDERELLVRMCHCLVEAGGHPFAAIVGFAKGKKPLRVISSTGPGALREGWLVAAEAAIEVARTSCEALVLTGSTAPPGVLSMDASVPVRSVVFIPAVEEAPSEGLFVIGATEPDAFDAAELRLLGELADDLAFGLRALRDRKARDRADARIRSTMVGTIHALGNTLELRDPYTAGHQRRVAQLATAVARLLRLSEDDVQGLYLAAIVHDVGKMSIPGEILSRPGRLSELEFALVKTHVTAGYDVLRHIDFPWPIATIVLQHHERMDGSGYPSGLREDGILLQARILAVCDTVEAMTTHRPYRAGLGRDAALAEIVRGRGSAYDAAVVDACLRVFHDTDFHFDQGDPAMSRR